MTLSRRQEEKGLTERIERKVCRKSNYVVEDKQKEGTVEEKTEEEGKMSVRWETEGLQTVGIVCLVIMFLKLMHLLGLIDITETGEATWERGNEADEEVEEV